jgi:hypothetical protein
MDPTKFSKTVKPICRTVLDLPPCCIEFVPTEEQFFIVGTYDLQKEEAKEVSIFQITSLQAVVIT